MLSGFVHNTGQQMIVAIANAATPVGESHNISEDERSELVNLTAIKFSFAHCKACRGLRVIE
jgi:hypothetical protein